MVAATLKKPKREIVGGLRRFELRLLDARCSMLNAAALLRGLARGPSSRPSLQQREGRLFLRDDIGRQGPVMQGFGFFLAVRD